MSKSWYDYYQFVIVASKTQSAVNPQDLVIAKMLPYDNGPTNAVDDAIAYSKENPAEYVYLYEWTLRQGMKLVAFARNGKPDIGLCTIYAEVTMAIASAVMPCVSAYLATMVRASEGDAAEVKGDAIP